MRAELAEVRKAMARHGALQADLRAQLAMATEARATAEQERLAAVSHAQHASVDLQAQVLSFFKPALQFAQSVCDPLTPVLPTFAANDLLVHLYADFQNGRVYELLSVG
jgi:hypothetical protein